VPDRAAAKHGAVKTPFVYVSWNASKSRTTGEDAKVMQQIRGGERLQGSVGVLARGRVLVQEAR
jgi:hypothetical protein